MIGNTYLLRRYRYNCPGAVVSRNASAGLQEHSDLPLVSYAGPRRTDWNAEADPPVGETLP